MLVQQGRVVVAARSGLTPEPPLALPANTRITFDRPGLAAGIPQPLPPGVVSRALAWREGKIAFKGESLQHAVDAFARYSDTRVVIRDEALAREPVSGLFSANDPAGFRSEGPHVGITCDSTCSYECSPEPYKKKTK